LTSIVYRNSPIFSFISIAEQVYLPGNRYTVLR